MSIGAVISAGRNSFPHLCCIQISVLDPFYQTCPTAAICHTTTKWSRIVVGRFSPCCHPTNIHFLCPGPTKYHRRHYFQSSHCMYERVKENWGLCPATEQLYGIPYMCLATTHGQCEPPPKSCARERAFSFLLMIIFGFGEGIYMR